MSYGFHRLGSNADPIKAKTEMGGIMARLFGHVAPVSVTDRKENEIVTTISKPLEPPKVADTLTPDPRQQGYTGNTCDRCGGGRMIRAGHCEVCSDCGTTTGCS